jgi:hypothetical protein
MLKDNSVSSGLRKRHLDIYPKHILTMKYTKLTRMEIQNTNIYSLITETQTISIKT